MKTWHWLVLLAAGVWVYELFFGLEGKTMRDIYASAVPYDENPECQSICPAIEKPHRTRPVITLTALLIGWVAGLLTLLVPLYLSWHVQQLAWLLPHK